MSAPLKAYRALIAEGGLVTPRAVYLASDVDRLMAEHNDRIRLEQARIQDILRQLNAQLEAAGLPPIVVGSKP